MSGTLENALYLAGLGYHVFPCKPDKTPATPHGFKDATTDQGKIKAWRWDGLIGIACETSRIFVIDIDKHEGAADGLRSWADLTKNQRDITIGPIQSTPSGGIHLIFRLPVGVSIPNNAGKLAPGIDLRSNGYICTGDGYAWRDHHGPGLSRTDAPIWLIDRIRNMNKRPEPIPQQPNHQPNRSTPGEYWLDYYLARAHVGNRNNSGFYLACQLRDSGLSEGEAQPIMYSYARGVPQEAGDFYTETAALKSLQSAYNGSKREPAHIPGLSNGHKPASFIPDPPEDDGYIPPELPAPDAELQPTVSENKQPADDKEKKPTEPELRDRWLERSPKTAYGLGEWRRYSGGVWSVVDEDIIAREIMAVLEQAQLEGIRPTASGLKSVIELARIKISIPDDRWDADPDVVVCKNGVLNIKTKALGSHKPENYFSSALPFDYDPQVDCPVWRYFLATTIPDAADFMQEFAGYACTTDTRHELAVWLTGPRGSGKSTLEEGLIAMIGDRSSVLGLADIERSRFSLWNLRGKTLAIASEQPALYIQSSHILNAIISGEILTIERKFKDPVDIRTHVKIVWAMNELPRVPDAGNGLFRRVKVIKFPALLEADRDPKIKEAIKLEGAGILNWALEGLHRLQARGYFLVPDCVKDATDHFQEANDIPAVFAAECCLIGADYKTKSSLLYSEYNTWCNSNGHKPKSSTAIAEEWTRLGFEKKKRDSRYVLDRRRSKVK